MTTDRVTLAMRQAELLREVLPETRLLLALTDHPEAQALVRWAQDAPAAGLRLAEARAGVAGALAALLGGEVLFWTEYLTASAPVSPPQQAPEAPEPRTSPRRQRLSDDEKDAFRAVYAALSSRIGLLRSPPHNMTYLEIARGLGALGLTVSVSSLNSVGNGYALRQMDVDVVVMRLTVAQEVLTGLDLIVESRSPQAARPAPEQQEAPAIPQAAPSPDAEPPVAAPQSPPLPAAPLRVRAPQAATTDRERREVAKKLLQQDGLVVVRKFQAACGQISLSTALHLLSHYPFLGPPNANRSIYHAAR